MLRTNVVGVGLSVVVAVLLLPWAASAQQASASGIAGVVKDTSGAVLPGVTVEAASPALIEKVRTAVSDSEGRYNIVDLRPGSYVVTFTLAGFNVLKRDGIELTSGFTATVNADLQVGALTETITVTGESPLVDTRNARKQTVVSSDLLNVLPSSVKNLNNLVALTPGFRGNEGFDVTGAYSGQIGGTYHGKGGTNVQFDGMGIQHASGNQGYNANAETVQELVMSTSGITADSNADGAIVNMIPKEGGNRFAGSVAGLYANKSLMSDNLSDDLIARGLRSVNRLNYIYDAGFTLGGPVKRDRLWFYGSFREWGNERQAANKFYNATQGTPFYTADLSRPAFAKEWYESKAIRLTWKMTEKNKVNFFADPQRDCHCPALTASGSVNAPEAFFSYNLKPAGLYQVTWNAPLTSKLLFEAGVARVDGSWPFYRQPEVTRDDVSIVEQSTGMRYNSGTPIFGPLYYTTQLVPRFSQRFSASYVTGSHNFKAGLQLEESYLEIEAENGNKNVEYAFNRGVPVSLTQWATPYGLKAQNKDFGFFVQDQWTLNRMTVTYGIRYEYFAGYVPNQHVPATPNGWVPERNFAEVKNVPLWKDVDPRVGVAYDLFGDGRTALKVALGRYVSKSGITITQSNNPIQTSINSVSRQWNDTTFPVGDPRRGNFIPDCDLANRALNGECGAMLNQNFGGLGATTRYADDALLGYGARGYNWDFTAELQHQLRPGVSMSGGYYRNWFGSHLVTDNTLVTPADFDPFCITAPTDARLPNGGGYQVCGLYDVNPAKLGQVNSVITQAENYGKLSRVNDFFNVGITARLRSDLIVGGGVDTGRSVNDACFNVDSPGAVTSGLPGNIAPGGAGVLSAPVPFTATTVDGQNICRVVTPFRGQTQLKGFVTYPLPYDFMVSAVFQNISGPTIVANYAATNAEIAPSLNRSLAACRGAASCTSTATVPLIAPQTMFDDRLTRLDLRLAKRIALSQRVRLQANFNIYNLFNGSASSTLNTNYGPLWLQPSLLQDGRMVQFSANMTF
ncbi:MAG TPA: carboxypeptidase regulatory-like domain-containing protein [Vicinamibacterales bacterium]|nr:carboxypeptidase regulatory-like domain-containing protein [Vicinamibacterales bacterium]